MVGKKSRRQKKRFSGVKRKKKSYTGWEAHDELAREGVHPDDVVIGGKVNKMKLMDTLHELERNFIAQALQATRGNKTAAAHLLGINRTTLVEKCRRWGFPLRGVCNRKAPA